MKLYKFKINFKDHRGIISDILQKNINSITYITIKKGKIRANHFHKKTIQWNYVLQGRVNLFYKKSNKSETTKKILLKKKDLVVCNNFEPHAFKAVTDCEIMVFTKGPRQGKEYENDTFRLKVPLVKK
jgi:quercetin dioxygenase-like cupin family protein